MVFRFFRGSSEKGGEGAKVDFSAIEKRLLEQEKLDNRLKEARARESGGVCSYCRARGFGQGKAAGIREWG